MVAKEKVDGDGLLFIEASWRWQLLMVELGGGSLLERSQRVIADFRLVRFPSGAGCMAKRLEPRPRVDNKRAA